jgi:hypothetical protein
MIALPLPPPHPHTHLSRNLLVADLRVTGSLRPHTWYTTPPGPVEAETGPTQQCEGSTNSNKYLHLPVIVRPGMKRPDMRAASNCRQLTHTNK